MVGGVRCLGESPGDSPLSPPDFDWSAANDFLVSASSDGTCRLWDSSTGACLREIHDTSGTRTLCCRFHPQNNNFVVVSPSKLLLIDLWPYPPLNCY